MQREYSILSDGYTITIQGLTLVAGNQFHIYDGSSDYGLYTIGVDRKDIVEIKNLK